MSCPLSKSRVPFFKGFRPSSAKALALVWGASLFVGGCASSGEPPQDNLVVARLVSELETLKKSSRETQAENQMSGEQLALLKVEIASLKEQQATMRRQLDVVKRGARSGIYEEQGGSKNGFKTSEFGAEKSAEKATEKPLVNMDVPALKMPDMSKGRSAQSIPFETAENNSLASPSKEENDSSSSLATSSRLSQPSQIFADAQLKMQRANYGEAIVDLAQLQKDKPNFEDNGLVALLLAECWLKIGQPENALPVLRSFYLKHPQSPDLLKAKMLEGRVLEKSGAREKALIVYREVLALGPETAFAREARTALGRMRDAR